ncbi:hypothetical protein NQD34_010380 [Periophthalmus magnuspinnatus]|nr:hypothetical protein NQD34_010380 [Periophthalmus magnuspinnatus]
MEQTGSMKMPLRRSFSEHVRDSTNRAWNGFWRSVRESRLWEIEAREACDWLRAAGFPQYVQLFRDGKFPIDLEWAKQDHGFLDKDAVDSLCRRLKTLNKSAELRLELRRTKRREVESEEEDFCALSPNWSYDRISKQWHRNESPADLGFSFSPLHNASYSSCSSDSEGLDHTSTQTWGSLGFSPRNKARSLGTCSSSCPSPGSSGMSLDGSLERSQSKNSTSLLRKIDKLKLRRAIGGWGRYRSLGSSVEEDDTLHCTDSPQSAPNSPVSSCPSSPQTSSQSETSSRSHSQSESSSVVSTPSPVTRVRSKSKKEINQNDQKKYLNQINLCHSGTDFDTSLRLKTGTFPSLRDRILDQDSVNWRTGSFHGYQRRRSSGRRHGTSSLSSANQNAPSCDVVVTEPRLSVYDNVHPVMESEHAEMFGRLGSDEVFSALDRVLERITDLQQKVSSWTQDLSEDQDQDSIQDLTEDQDLTQDLTEDRDSIQDSSPEHSPESTDLMHHMDQGPEEQTSGEEQNERLSREDRPGSWSPESDSDPGGILGLSWSRLALLQKLALLRLTALMDKYSPTSRQGWSWTVPKPQRKSKGSEVKGRRVFGVPLLVNMQQTGEPLPPSVLRAMVYVRNECVDQMGVFRKSGLKSRIQALRDQLERGPDQVSFSGLCAFDVADLIKQYLRDLPEPLLSSKLNNTVLHIYQYFPQDVQMDVVQSAILLLPDERREALRTLLYFLYDVVSSSEENHMTHTNMAVCLAPSLFHLSAGQRDNHRNRPGQRKCSLGPDQRDLSESLAATQALGHMISEAHTLFQLPVFWSGSTCTSPDSEEGVWSDSPGCHGDSVEGEELSEAHLKLERSTESLLKLSQDQDQVWTSFTTPDGLQLDYRKCPDLSPLPLWRARLELEVPPPVVLRRVLSERSQFDPRLQRDSRLRPLGPDSDLYLYQIQSQGHGLGSIPPTVYSLLRSWQSDPSSGPMYVSSVSISQQDVPKTVHVHSCMYLLEPIGDKKTRLTHFCSTEYRGRSLEWHVKVSGHLLANELLSIRDSFEQ